HADELPALLRRAADQEPDLVRAVGWLARAGDWDEAARRMQSQGPSLMAFGGLGSLSHLLALFPAAQMAMRPEMLLLRALVAFMKFEFENMRDASVAAAREFERQGLTERAVWANVMVGLAMENTGQVAQSSVHLAALPVAGLDPQVRALTAFSRGWAEFGNGRAENAAPHFEAMLQALEERPDPTLWSQVFFHSILTGVVGMRPLLERFDDGAMRLVHDVPCQLRAGVYNSKAWLALGRGDLPAALSWVLKADEDTRWIGSPRSVLTETLMCRSMVEAVLGNREAAWLAHETLMADMQAAPPSNRLTHNYELIFTGARIAWLLDQPEQLPRWDAELRAAKNALEWPLAALDRDVSAGMLAASRGDLAEAARLLRGVALAPERSNFFIGGQSRWMLADVLARNGQLDEAADVLRPWLDAALAGDDVGAALLAGRQVLERLAHERWGSRLSAAQLALVRQLADLLLQARAGRPVAAVAESAPVAGGVAARSDDGLTERELEVLARIAAGESNKLIARALDLSPFTVKRHVANILDKLAVSSRGQAAAVWRGMKD
ncbi:MAG TPA: LuxR C-terminal-related transcriptional regulator, partial [Roseateles sp.]